MPKFPQVECDGSDAGVKICEGSPARQSFRMVNEREEFRVDFFSHISTVGTEQDNEETAPLSPEWLQHDSPEEGRRGSKDFSSMLLEDEYSNAASNLEDVKCELDSALRLSRFLTRRLNACHSGLIKNQDRHLQYRALMLWKLRVHRRIELRACWLSALRRSGSRFLRQIFVTWSTEVANWVTDASKQQLEAEHAVAARSSVVEKFSNEIGVLEAALAERRREIKDLELALVTAKSEIKDLTTRLEDTQQRATGRDRAREVELKNLELELEKARSETNDLLMLYNENLCTEQIGISKLAKGLSGVDTHIALLEAHLEEYVCALKKQKQREADRLRDRARETERKKERGRRTENVSEPLTASATDLWLTGSIDAQEGEEVLIMERMTCGPYLCLMNLRHKYLHEVEEVEEVRRSALLASHRASTVGVELEKTCVSFVVPNGPAGRPKQGAPLEVGDEILIVDGVPANEQCLEEQFHGCDVVGTELRVRVRKCGTKGRGSQVEDVVLIRHDSLTLSATHDLTTTLRQLGTILEGHERNKVLSKDKRLLAKQLLCQHIQKVKNQMENIDKLRGENERKLRSYVECLQRLVALNQSLATSELLDELERGDPDYVSINAHFNKLELYTFQCDQLRRNAEEGFRTYALELENALLRRFSKEPDVQLEKESSNQILASLLERWGSFQHCLLDEERKPEVRARLKRMQKVIAHVIWDLAPEPQIAVWNRWMLTVRQRKMHSRKKEALVLKLHLDRSLCVKSEVLYDWHLYSLHQSSQQKHQSALDAAKETYRLKAQMRILKHMQHKITVEAFNMWCDRTADGEEAKAEQRKAKFKEMEEYVQLLAKQIRDTESRHVRVCACSIQRALRLQKERCMEDFVVAVMMEKRSQSYHKVAMTRFQRRRLFGIFRKLKLSIRMEYYLYRCTLRRIKAFRLRHAFSAFARGLSIGELVKAWTSADGGKQGLGHHPFEAGMHPQTTKPQMSPPKKVVAVDDQVVPLPISPKSAPGTQTPNLLKSPHNLEEEVMSSMLSPAAPQSIVVIMCYFSRWKRALVVEEDVLLCHRANGSRFSSV